MMKISANQSDHRRRQLLGNLSLPLALEEAGPPRVTLQLLSVLTLFVVAVLVWAGVTSVGQVAVTTGQVVPAAPLQSVQHLEGGIVDQILVEEGARVSSGQPLVRFRAASTSADLDQLRAREASLRFQVERLSAYVDDRDPNFDDIAGFNDLQQGQLDVLDTRREADANRRQVLLLQADQQREKREGVRNKQASLRSQAAILGEQLEVREQLLAKGLTSKLIVLDTRRALAALQADLDETDADLAQSEQAVREIETRLVELEANSDAEAFDELAKVGAELAEVREAISKQEDRFSRLLVRAPAAGIVQGLAVETVGGVVAPGQELMKIVPTDGNLLAEVRVSPQDIGHVRVGQSAAVKVSAFDVARLGDVAGEITQLSPSTFIDDQGNPYYRARILLGQNYVGAAADNNVIQPGMVVTADVQTGARSILQYLAGPAYRAFSTALRER